MSLEEGRKIRTKFNRKLRNLQVKARCADKEISWPAARNILVVLTEMNVALKDAGCRIDENNKVVLRTPEWVAEQIANEKPIDKLARLARNGDENAAKEMICLMAAECCD